MPIVSFLIAVCMVGSGLTGTPDAADRTAAPAAADLPCDHPVPGTGPDCSPHDE